MIDISKFKIGDTIYAVSEHNNSFNRQKIYMTDAEGNEWFRYDRPHYEYSVHELIYCGKVVHVISGEVEVDGVYDTEYHFKYPHGKIYMEYEGIIPGITDWFATKEEAEEYIEQMKTKRNA